MSTPSLFNWHLHSIRVRYQETDRMGVVFHANYATWFEIGRTELIRAAGLTYAAIEERGLLLPVVELRCRYIQPARYDDTVVICTRVAESSSVRIAFDSQVRRIAEPEAKRLPSFVASDADLPGELLAEGGTRHVWVNSQWRPVRPDKLLPDLSRLLAPERANREEEA